MLSGALGNNSLTFSTPSTKYASGSQRSYFFSDTKNPQQILNEYSTLLAHIDNMTVKQTGCCTQDKYSICYDLAAMQQCDCLIRPNSNFGIVADLLGKHRMTISPHLRKYRGNKFKVTPKVQHWDPAIVGTID